MPLRPRFLSPAAGARAVMAREAFVRYTLAMPLLSKIRFWRLFLFCLALLAGACGDPPRTLRVALPDLEEKLDPLATYEPGARMVAANIYESLLNIDDEGNVIPWLARRWEWDSTRTVLTLILRRGIKFHDGSLLDAKVVVENLRRAADYSTYEDSELSSSFPFLIEGKESIDALNDTTLSLRLASPHLSLLRMLATPVLTPIMGAGMEIVPGGTFPAGTGWFRLTRFDPGEDLLILDRFEDYWGTHPQPQRIRFMAVPRSEDALEMLKDGKIDLSLSISVAEISEINASESMDLVTGPHVNYLVIGMNNQRPPFNRLEARRALALGFDRERVTVDLYRGAARPTRNFIGEGLLPQVKSPLAPEYNRDAARALIKEVIPPEYRTITIVLPPPVSPVRQHWIYETIGNQLKGLGLQLQPLYTTSDDEYVRLVEQMEWDISLDGMVTDNGDLFEFLYTLYAQPSSKGGTGLFGLEADGFQDALEVARSALDSTTRIHSYEKVLDIIAREIPCVPYCFLANFLVRSSDVVLFKLGTNINAIFSQVRKKSWR